MGKSCVYILVRRGRRWVESGASGQSLRRYRHIKSHNPRGVTLHRAEIALRHRRQATVISTGALGTWQSDTRLPQSLASASDQSKQRRLRKLGQPPSPRTRSLRMAA